jgi:alpha-L-rhamnosidase
VVQTAYRIQVASDSGFGEVIHDTGEVSSGQSHAIEWPSMPMASRQECWWRVRIQTTAGASDWSHPAALEAPLWQDTDWTASFVVVGGSEAGPSPLLRRQFKLSGRPERARLYVTGLGVYRVEINGQPVGDELLAPGWTSYQHRLVYRTQDVTGLLRPGTNVLGAELADGWYRGHLTPERLRNLYGERLGLIAQLEVDLGGDESVIIGSDTSWEWAGGPRRSADIYDGEIYDTRVEVPGWSGPLGGTVDSDSSGDAAWEPVEPDPDDHAHRAALTPAGPPVRVVEELGVVNRWIRPDGRVVLDFGHNIVGWPRLHLDGPSGARVTVRHAEVLEADGALHTRALRSAKATDTYVLDGEGPRWVEPCFTFHGFRYAEVATTSAEVSVGDAVGVVVSSDLERIGGFACSDDLVNRLQANIVRSQRGNFVSVPTDCPQRDERLGWTGDIQVFAPTGAFNFDADSFLSGWLADLAADQKPSGGVPPIIPSCRGQGFKVACAAWADAAVMVPWALYEAYGNLRVLERQYPSMKAWVSYAAGRAGDDQLWTGDFQFGDWLDPDAPAAEPWKAKAPGDYVATAYLAESARILGETAALLDRVEDAAAYRRLARSVREAMWEAWPETPAASQTAAALALRFDLVPDAERSRVAEALAARVEEAGTRLATGFVGTPLLCPALVDGGRPDLAYGVLMARQFPSWLYPVLQGATSIWERWDAIRPDGSIHRGELGIREEGGMLSFNHYAYGAVGAWLYRSVAGLAPDPDEPGYRHVLMAPLPGAGLAWAGASLRTPYGDTSIHWHRDGRDLVVEVSLPANTWATLSLPSEDFDSIRLDGSEPSHQSGLRAQRGRELDLGSGTYSLSCTVEG